MNVVFIGSSKFGLRCLKLLNASCECNLAGVITSREKFAISYNPKGVTNVLYAELGNYCQEKNIEHAFLQSSMNESLLIEKVNAWKPDLFIVVGWYHILPKSWRNLAPAYGMHASLLPNYSGGAPLVWAMINGEKKTGITLFKMDDGIDSGPIVGQKEEAIHLSDTISTLYSRIEDRGLELLDEHLPLLVINKAKLKPQPENGRKIMPQRSPKDGIIDWQKDSVSIYNFVRAQTHPYPGAFSKYNKHILRIWSCKVAGGNFESVKTGLVWADENGECFVKCRKGAIQLMEISYQNKNYFGKEIHSLFGADEAQLDDNKLVEKSLHFS